MGKINILIVEDNPADILLIKEYLSENRHIPYDLAEAETLESALSLLSHYNFDAVLLDLRLPDSAGLDTVRKIITPYPDTAVIVLSGLQDEELALKAVRFGAQDFLEKQHLSPASLSKSLLYSIERKKAMQEKEDLLYDLTLALKKIESLEGILPICLSCKKILNENNQWERIEDYIRIHSDAKTINLICPECKTNFEGEH
jgi:CheY-like chemotaxis protein